MSVPNMYLRISTLPLSSIDKKYSLGEICLQRKRGLSKSDGSYAKESTTVLQLEGAHRVPRAAVGTSSVWSHASSRGAPQYPSWLPGNPTLEMHSDLLWTLCSFSSCEHPHKAQSTGILTVETKMCIFVINLVHIVITCLTFLCISLSWQFFIEYNVCLGDMLSLLDCKGMHLPPSELSFSLHAQKISPSMENSQTSVLCAG